MNIKGKFDHFNFNVTNLERSIAFYEKALGLHEHSRMEAPDGAFIIVYLTDDQSEFMLELTWLRDHPQAYNLGELPARARRLRRHPPVSQGNGLRMLRKRRHGPLLHQRPRRVLD